MIVTTNEREAVERSIPALLPELRVSDNHSSDGTRGRILELAPDAIVVDNGGNVGFPAAVNAGATRASGDIVLLLNPDAAVAPGFADDIRRPIAEGRDWDAWQALVTMDDGKRVNTAGGVVHWSCVSWAGEIGTAADVPREPHEVGFASGACLAIRTPVWRALGGFPQHFFLYFDDVDIALRIRLGGGHVGVEPRARADHDYEFAKGKLKWRMLERNRWATILRTDPGPVLALLLPALLALELAVFASALAGGWGGQKLRAAADLLRSLPTLLRERRAIQSGRAISSGEFARWLTAELSSPYLGGAAENRALAALQRGYWRVVRALLRTSS